MAKSTKKKPELRVVDAATENAEVLFMQGYSDIPPPSVPLGKMARQVYDNWCRVLLKRGLLTFQNHLHVDHLAIGKDMIAKAYDAGKQPSRWSLEAVRAAEMKLGKLSINETVHSAAGQGQSNYARFGFAKRARSRQDGKD